MLMPNEEPRLAPYVGHVFQAVHRHVKRGIAYWAVDPPIIVDMFKWGEGLAWKGMIDPAERILRKLDNPGDDEVDEISRVKEKDHELSV